MLAYEIHRLPIGTFKDGTTKRGIMAA